ncbi:MAG: alanyl-tRNA editing protein [Acidobacteriaceae bacterium]
MTERLYYDDPFATSFDATIADIQEVSRANDQSLWRIALDRSAFYPTSGGQPFDTGNLIATARSGAELTAEIIGVEEDERDGRIWHLTAKPLTAGTQVRGVVDAARRTDHMQQHSGQHLLSAAFVKICNAPTVSFHLGEASSTIDLAADGLAENVLVEVAEFANEVIAQDRAVTVSVVPRAEAETLLAAGELRKLPPRAGDLRIIEIADFDRTACGGTHVRSTGQIGGLHLRGAEKVKQGIRIEFVCGLRAMHAARSDFRVLTEAARQLSVGLAETPEAIQRLQAEARQAAKQVHALRSELLDHRAKDLLRQTPVENGLRCIELQLTAPEAPDAGHAKLLASKLTAVASRTVALLSWQESCERATATTVIFARSSDLPFDCGTLLRETLAQHGGRGGGPKDMAQGSVPAQHLPTVIALLREHCFPTA